MHSRIPATLFLLLVGSLAAACAAEDPGDPMADDAGTTAAEDTGEAPAESSGGEWRQPCNATRRRFAAFVGQGQRHQRQEQQRPQRVAMRRHGCAVDEVQHVGEEPSEADKAVRVRITPLPSIGHSQADGVIRRQVARSTTTGPPTWRSARKRSCSDCRSAPQATGNWKVSPQPSSTRTASL